MTDGYEKEERGEEAGHVNWNGIHTYTHMLAYINRYSVKTRGTVTLGPKVHVKFSRYKI